MTDAMPTLSVGDIRLPPTAALWLATGEANTSSSAYVGTGVYRLANPKKRGVSPDRQPVWRRGARKHFHRQAPFTTCIGNVYAATSRGVWQTTRGPNAGAWGASALTQCGSGESGRSNRL
jgi:hypothetical protein